MFRPFPPKLRTLLLLGRLPLLGVIAVVAAIVAVGIGAGTDAVALGVLAWVVVFGAGVAGVVWWSGESMRRRSWALTEQTVELREGVFWRQHIVLPRSRVQNVTIATGPLRSALNLRTVVIHSAGAATPNITLLGVSPDEGEWAQQVLLADRQA